MIITRGPLQKKDIDPLFCLFVDGMLSNTNRKAADVFASAAFPDVLCGVVSEIAGGAEPVPLLRRIDVGEGCVGDGGTGQGDHLSAHALEKPGDPALALLQLRATRTKEVQQ